MEKATKLKVHSSCTKRGNWPWGRSSYTFGNFYNKGLYGWSRARLGMTIYASNWTRPGVLSVFMQDPQQASGSLKGERFRGIKILTILQLMVVATTHASILPGGSPCPDKLSPRTMRYNHELKVRIVKPPVGRASNLLRLVLRCLSFRRTIARRVYRHTRRARVRPSAPPERSWVQGFRPSLVTVAV